MGAEKLPATREDLVRLLEDGPGAKLGKPKAPVAIVEVFDFQCVYCWKFHRETFPRVQERYVQTGEARLVFGHLAILGEASAHAASAAECAGEQGKFWPYHDLLFERRGPPGLDPPPSDSACSIAFAKSSNGYAPMRRRPDKPELLYPKVANWVAPGVS